MFQSFHGKIQPHPQHPAPLFPECPWLAPHSALPWPHLDFLALLFLYSLPLISVFPLTLGEPQQQELIPSEESLPPSILCPGYPLPYTCVLLPAGKPFHTLLEEGMEDS